MKSCKHRSGLNDCNFPKQIKKSIAENSRVFRVDLFANKRNRVAL